MGTNFFFLGNQNPDKLMFWGGEFEEEVAPVAQRRNMNVRNSTAGLGLPGFPGSNASSKRGSVSLGVRKQSVQALSTGSSKVLVDAPIFEFRAVVGDAAVARCVLLLMG